MKALNTTKTYLKEVSMTTEQLKDHVRNSMQHYYNKEQVIDLINKLNNESKRQSMATVLELF
jgi:murein endopeptidase